jgi:hypothetical protein
MFKKILGPIVERALKPYFERGARGNQQKDIAEQLYRQGRKAEALQVYIKLLDEDPGYKPARGRIVQISKELEEAKQIQSNKPK